MSRLSYVEDYVLSGDDPVFIRCVRTLLSHTFIVREKDSALYEYASQPGHFDDLSAYLKAAGFALQISQDAGVIMLVNDESADETAGLKRESLYSFNKEEASVLLVLWKIWMEKMAYEDEVVISQKDLTDRLQYFGIRLQKGQLDRALAVLRRFNLISVRSSTVEESMITLYPSLNFCITEEEMQKLADKYLGKEKENGEDHTETGASD